MKTRGWMLVALVLVAACGKDKKSAPKGGDTEKTATKKADPKKAPPKAKDEGRADRIKELKAKRTELAAKIKDIQSQLEGIDARHAEEKKGLPDIRKLRRRYGQLIQDAGRASSTYKSMKKRFDELQKFADSAVTGELKTLRDQMKEVEGRYDEAQSGWRRALDDARMGVVEASPAKLALETCRAMKSKWFELTPAARRGSTSAGDKKKINDSFRGWLKEKEDRGKLCAEILGQEGAPSGKTPDSFDFADLDFYILLELMEDALDRQNIATERKELAENEKKLAVIEAEMDALREKIAKKMQEGGGELEEYEDLAGRIEAARKKALSLETQRFEMARDFDSLEKLSERHMTEEDDLSEDLEKSKRELAKVTRSLRSLGVS